MKDPGIVSEAATRLIELSSEIDELEAGRVGLLRRVEEARGKLLAAGDRAQSVRASAAMLRDHLTNAALVAADVRAIREKMQEFDRSMTEVTAESLGLLFEAEGLQESLGEAEDEMERLLVILIEGRARDQRGH